MFLLYCVECYAVFTCLQCLLHVTDCQQMYQCRLIFFTLLWQCVCCCLLYQVFCRHYCGSLLAWWLHLNGSLQSFATKLFFKCHKFNIIYFYIVFCQLFRSTRVVLTLWPHLPSDTRNSGFLDNCPYSLNIDDGMHDGVKLPEVMEWIVQSNVTLKGIFWYSFLNV